MDKRIIINYFAGPAAGKTTAASDLFVSLKKHNIDTFLVLEFAQELILQGNRESLQNQVFVSCNQYHRVLTAYKNYTVTIVDSPILLGYIYQRGLPESFGQLMLDLHNQFQSVNILLTRESGYHHSMVGRLHSLTESIGIDREIESMLDTFNVPYYKQDGTEEELTEYVTQQILEYLDDVSN